MKTTKERSHLSIDQLLSTKCELCLGSGIVRSSSNSGSGSCVESRCIVRKLLYRTKLRGLSLFRDRNKSFLVEVLSYFQS